MRSTIVEPGSLMALRLRAPGSAMRNLRALVFLMLAACEAGPADIKEPPVLRVTSPARSLVQDHAGQLLVTGTVAPSASGDAVEKVLVNNVQATLDHGAFRAMIDVREGATLIHTVAQDRAGSIASDTRTVLAGQLRAVGTSVGSAVTAALSADTFSKLSAAAGPLVESVDMAALLAPMQPMVHFNDPNGEDCLFAQGFVDNIALSAVKVSLTPVDGGLTLRAELDGIAVDAHVRWGLACSKHTTDLAVGADRIVIEGTLKVTPNGSAGFATTLDNPTVQVTNSRLPDIFPPEIVDGLHLHSLIDLVISKGAELAMNPLVNQALGALAGPQQLDILGKHLTVQVAPSAVTFTANGAEMAMTMMVLLGGSESSPGYIYTDNNVPAMDAGDGFALGVADDLANQMLAEALASGLLELALPTPGGAFDTAQVHMSLPPMISSGAADGNMHVVLGDMLTTFKLAGSPVAKVAINAAVDLKIAPVGTGGSFIGLQLGTPEIHVDVLDDIPNVTGLPSDRLASAATAGLDSQIDTISKLLRVIPLPAIAGLQVRDLAIGADDGYVMVRGRFD
jgi:hypothetical protein